MKDCIFCKIVSGEAPCYKVFENADFLAFLDIRPVTRGHVMVIPKKHFKWTWDVPNFGEYWETAKKVSLAIMKSLSAEKVQFVTLGEAVAHAHIHIVPRYKDDGLKALPDWELTKEFSSEEMKEIADKINKEL